MKSEDAFIDEAAQRFGRSQLRSGLAKTRAEGEARLARTNFELFCDKLVMHGIDPESAQGLYIIAEYVVRQNEAPEFRAAFSESFGER